MNPDDYRDGLDASSSPWNDGDGGGGDDDDDASSLPPREAHDGKKIPRVFAGWRLHILPPRRQQRRPRERRGSSRFDDHDAFTPLSRGAAAARRDDDDRDFDFDERSDASTTPGGSSAPAVYFGDGGAPGGARQNARVRSRTSHDNVTVYPRDETAHPYVHPFRASASADDDDDDDGALNQPALRSFWDERSPDSDVASKTSAGLDFTRHLDDSEDGTWRDELDDYASEEDGEGDRGGFYGRPSPSYPAFSPSPRGRTRARRIPRLTAVRLNAEENNAEDDAEEDAGDPGALVDFLGRVATGAPMLRLTRDFFHRDGLLGTGAFKRAEIRAHVAPDAAVGWRGVAYDGGSAGERGGGRKDAPFTLSLDAEAALAPQGEKGGTRARVTTGVHAQFAVMPGTFPDERLTAGLSVEALAQSERLSRAEREEIRFETGRRAPKRAPRLRRRNTLWARLRLWRGLFVRVASRVKIEPDGAGGNDVSFGAPRVEFHVEYDPKLEDKRADARWDFTRPRSAPVYVGRPIAFPGLGGLGGALKGLRRVLLTLVHIRPRWRGERRSLRTLPGVSLRPHLAFNPRPRRPSTPTDAFQLHPDIRSYGTTLRNGVVGLGLGGGSGSGSGSVATNLDVTRKVTDADGALLQVGDDPYEDEDAAYVENVVRRMPTNATLEAARKKEEREKKKEEDRARRERDKRDKRQREEDARAEKKRQDAAKRERARLEREERLELQKEKVAEQKKLMEARRKDAAEAKAAEAEAALRAAEKGSAAAASSTSTTTAKDATTATTEWKNARSDAAAVAVAAAAAAEARRRANKEAEAARKREEAEAARAERKRLEDEARLNREETRVAEANARKRAEEEARLSREAAKKAAEDARRAAEEDAAAAREAKRRLEREAAEAAARSKKLREDAERDTKRAEADRKETERLAAEKRRIEEETRRTLMRREEKERKRREREEDRNRRDAEMARRKAERDAEEDEKRAKKAAMETRRRIERNEAREKRWAEEARRKELKKEEERRQREGAFYTLVPIRPRSRGERRSLRTLPGDSLLPAPAFNPRPRHLSTQLTPLNSTPTFARMERP